MEENIVDEIFMFDTLYTTNQLQILKILFPFLPETAKGKLAIFIKWKELEYAVAFEKNNLNACNDKTKPPQPDFDLLRKKLLPYCSKSEQNLLQQIFNLIINMEKYKDIMNILPLMESMNSEGGNDMNLDAILKNMLSEEQQAMFELFQGGM